jgi:glycosyltransferase involved in cell wall biosynthesis
VGKPRAGLIVQELEQVGGLRLASARHVRLLADDIDVIPIALTESKDESEWSGVIEASDYHGHRGYRVRAADFRSDMLFSKSAHLRQFAYARAVMQIAQREKLDVLHVFGAFYERPLIGAYAAAQLDLPLIVSFRGIDLDAWLFGPYLAQLQTALGAARACVVMNEGAKRLVENLLRPQAPVFVSHNYVEPDAFTSDAEIALPHVSGSVIGCVAEFRRVVGLDFLLRAFEELASKRDVSLLLVGPSRAEEAYYYTRFIESLSNAARVIRTGPVAHENVLAYLNACDVVAFPSFSDGSPNKLLEAMAAGRAIVAANAGGIPEMIRDGVDGVLVDATNAGALASAIASLLDDPDRRKKLGDSARARVASDFNVERARRDALAYYRAAGLRL